MRNVSQNVAKHSANDLNNFSDACLKELRRKDQGCSAVKSKHRKPAHTGAEKKMRKRKQTPTTSAHERRKEKTENQRAHGTRIGSNMLDGLTTESQKKQRAEPTRQLNGEGERERRTSQQANVRAKKGRESDWNPNEIYGVPLES